MIKLRGLGAIQVLNQVRENTSTIRDQPVVSAAIHSGLRVNKSAHAIELRLHPARRLLAAGV